MNAFMSALIVKFMSFNSMIDAISNLVSAYNLNVSTRKSGVYQYQDVRGIVDSRKIYIAINFTSNTICWRDSDTEEEKMYRF